MNVRCRIQEYQNSSLQAYFEENALLFPVETIMGKLLISMIIDSLHGPFS
jgi:hypothetical protein